MDASTQSFFVTIIAVYGAVLATLGFGLSLALGIHELRRDRPRLKTNASYGVLTNAQGISSEPLVFFEALNTGSGSLGIETFGLLMADGSKQVIINPYLLDLPLTLNERKKCTAGYACRWLRENDRREDVVAAFFNDEMGKMWKVKLRKKFLSQCLEAPDTGYLVQWNADLRIYYPEYR